MKYLSVLFFTFAFLSSVKSQKTNVFELSGFEELIVVGNFPVEIITGEQKEVVVLKKDETANLDNLSFSYSQKTLTIKYSGSFVEKIGIDLKLYYPQSISSVEARRGAQIKINKAGNFTSSVSYKAINGGKLVLDGVIAPLIKAEVNKGGSISIAGKAPIFEPTIITGGSIAAVHVKSEEVIANITFGGEIICAPIELLKAKVTSGGSISYTGNPKVKKEIKLGGTIKNI